MAAFLVGFLWSGFNKMWLCLTRWWKLPSTEVEPLTNEIVRLDQDYVSVLLFELVVIIWLIQVKDGKLLDEMAVSMTGLANKVGLAEVCHPVQTQNHFPLSLLGALAGDDVRGTPLRMPSSQRWWPRGNWFCCDNLFYATLMYCHLFIFLAAIF